MLAKLSELLIRAKEQLKPVVANVERILSPVTQFVRANPITSGFVLGVPAGAASALGVSYLSKKIKKSSAKKSRSKRRKKAGKSSRRRKRGRRRYYPHTAGKSRDRSSKRIRYTKKGQPYIIKANGRALFIKKSSAKRSRKMKGGRY